MIGSSTKRESQETKAARMKIRELFEARDAARAALVAAEDRVQRLADQLNMLQASLPGLRGAIKDREYDWRREQIKQENGEGSPEAVGEAGKGLDSANSALEEAIARIPVMEGLIAEATNGIGALKIAAEAAARSPWAAISEEMTPAVRDAAALINRFYTVELNHVPSVPGDVFHRKVIPLGDVANIARELEAAFRR